MSLLLDTHILVWMAIKPELLSSHLRARLEDPNETLVFSVCSIWEIVIKTGLQRPDFNVDAALLRDDLLRLSISELTISSAHTLAVRQLPDLHKDPFDRLLLAQARVEGHQLVTSDTKIHQYGADVLAS